MFSSIFHFSRSKLMPPIPHIRYSLSVQPHHFPTYMTSNLINSRHR